MKTRKFAVLALSLMMVLTMGTSVFAAGENSSDANKSSSATEAKMVKYFKAPLGVTLPNETFKFNFTPASSGDSAYAVDPDDFTALDTTIALSDMTAENAESQNKIASKSIAEIFAGYTFPHAGEYTFKVSEDSTKATEGMTYATNTYKLRLLVDKGGKITDVTVQDGDGEDGEKVDPTDTDPTDNGGTDGEGATTTDSNGGFTFTNTFTKDVTNHEEPKNPNPDPEDPDSPINKDDTESKAGAFELDKFVFGKYGDTTKDFTFTVSVDLPELNKDFNYAAQASEEIVDGKITLKHGESFKFKELPAGTKITVAEAETAGYTAKWTSSDDNDALTVLVGENGAYVICRNAFEDESVTPTGIIINNLPYVLLIGFALGGIVLFSRKKRYE